MLLSYSRTCWLWCTPSAKEVLTQSIIWSAAAGMSRHSATMCAAFGTMYHGILRSSSQPEQSVHLTFTDHRSFFSVG